MNNTGSIAANFHEGSRSEYLAQYFFSAFGTSFLVPHQEDSGIDLYCSLGTRKGPLLFIENYYLVQIKSKKDDIIYENDSCKWLLSHNYPILICLIDKKENILEIYTTEFIPSLMAKDKLKKVIITFNSNCNIKSSDEVYIAKFTKPIIRSYILDIGKSEIKKKYESILNAWIKLDQENIERKNIGFDLQVVPEKFETNTELNSKRVINGNFLSRDSSKYKLKYNSMLLLYLSNEINVAAKEMNRNKFNELFILSAKILHSFEVSNYALQYFLSSVAAGKKKTESTIDIMLKDSKGNNLPMPNITI